MEPDLYFIPILIRALDASDPAAALPAAFKEIVKIGRQDPYHEGYKQFQAFIDLAAYHHKYPGGHGFTRSDCSRLAVITGLVRTEPQTPTRREFLLERDGLPFARIELAPGGESPPLEALTPGRYTLKMTTGRVLWERKLESRDVRITAAESDARSQMATKTEKKTAPFSVEALLLGGQMVFKIYPGVRGAQAIVCEQK